MILMRAVRFVWIYKIMNIMLVGCVLDHLIVTLCHSIWHDLLTRTLFESCKGSRTNGFPSMLACHWRTHITIIAHKDKWNDFYNRICYGNAVCDHRYRFYDIECGWPGKVHDARVLRNSKIFTEGYSGTDRSELAIWERSIEYGNANSHPARTIFDQAV